MKNILILLFLFQGEIVAQKDLSDIQIQSLDGTIIAMKNFEGKKILIASASLDNFQNHRLNFLDSLQVANPSVVIIAVPALDFGGVRNESIIESIKNRPPGNIIVATPGEVKKNKGEKQSRLLRWLTNDADNSHFNAEVATDDQLYFISESGILYAVLEKGVPAAVIDQLLKQDDVKQ
jgi:glutathione peroxidase-family protein